MLKTTQERLQQLRDTANSEKAVLADLKKKEKDTERQIQQAEAELEKMEEDLKNTSNEQDIQNRAVDDAKKTALKATRLLDQALKEIGSKVCDTILLFMLETKARMNRMTRSKSFLSSGQPYIGVVDWTTSTFRSKRVICEMFPWKR